MDTGSFFSTVAGRLISFFGTIIATAAGVWLGQLFGLFPRPIAAVCAARDYLNGVLHRIARIAKKKHFVILIATLSDDDDGRQTAMIVRAFQGRKDVERYRTCRRLAPPVGQEDEDKANRVGRRWLARHAADILVWGEVIKHEAALRIWFISREADADFTRPQFQIAANELGKDFHDAFRLQLVALALAAIKPIAERDGTILAESIRNVAGRLEAILEGASDFSPIEMAMLSDALGQAKLAIGELTGERAKIENAISDFHRALDFRKESTGDDRAMSFIHMGMAHLLLANLHMQGSSVEEAKLCFEAAIEALGSSSSTTARATALLLLAHSRGLIAIRDKRPDKLLEAAHTVSELLDAELRQQSPRLWMRTIMQKGRMLAQYGTLTRNRALFNEGSELIRQAITGNDKAFAPTRWADRQVTFGGLLMEADEVWSDRALLDESADRLRETSSRLNHNDFPVLWAGVQNNLGSVLTDIGVKERDTSQIDEAIILLEDAIRVCPFERASWIAVLLTSTLANAVVKRDDLVLGPGEMQVHVLPSVAPRAVGSGYDWTTQGAQVRGVVKAQEEEERSIALLSQAVAAMERPLNALSMAGDVESLARVQNTYGTVLLRLAQRTRELDYYQRATDVFLSVREKWPRTEELQGWGRVSHNLGAVQIAKGVFLSDEVILQEGVNYFRAALEARTEVGNEFQVVETSQGLAGALYEKWRLTGDTRLLEEAESILRAVEPLLQRTASETLTTWVTELVTKIRGGLT